MPTLPMRQIIFARYCCLFLILLGVLGFKLWSTSPVQATEDCNLIVCSRSTQDDTTFLACNKQKQTCLQKNIAEVQGQANTLSNTIKILNGQISLQESQIAQTQAEIAQLERQVKDLGDRIQGLNISLDRFSEVLVKRVTEDYKTSRVNPNFLMLASDSLSNFMSDVKYLQLTRQQTTAAMQEAEAQKSNYDQQKTLKEQKQTEVEKKQNQLQKQQNDLTAQRASEQNLLAQTKNDEKRYQDLLAQAQAEVASFKNFSSSKGGGVLPPQNSPDGWYFSQRDERWAGACIGNSCGTRNSASLYEVGCLITSTAMVMKKFGQDVTPLTIARNSGYFFSNTAYMLQPWPTPSGYRYSRKGGFDPGQIDPELAADRPVIVHLRTSTVYGEHFIVLKGGSNGNYTMHDPWEGYDKSFGDFYSTKQILDYSILQKT